eukprot:1543537-Prymnesium_polylepis.1
MQIFLAQVLPDGVVARRRHERRIHMQSELMNKVVGAFKASDYSLKETAARAGVSTALAKCVLKEAGLDHLLVQSKPRNRLRFFSDEDMSEVLKQAARTTVRAHLNVSTPR